MNYKEKRKHLYYRDGAFFCVIKHYGPYIITSGNCKYADDATTNILRLIINKNELDKFIKIDYNKLNSKQYDFLTLNDINYYYSKSYKLNMTNDFNFVIEETREELLDNLLKDKYKYVIRKLKLEKIDGR